MNTLYKVLLGAALVLGVAGLWVGLSNSMSVSPASLGAAQPHNWTNFAGSFVSTKSGYAITNSDDSGFTPFIFGIGGNPGLYPSIIAGDFVQGANGYGATISTSTTITAAQFCSATSLYYNNLTALVTTTLPAATSSYLACGNPAFGGWSTQLLINDSTNTVNFVPGTGQTFRCETNGVGTSTVSGPCTASSVSLLGSSTVTVAGYWTSSSSQYLIWGNNFH